MRTRVLAALLLCSCALESHDATPGPDYPMAFVATEDVWWELEGPISERCSEVIGTALSNVIELSTADLQEACPPETQGTTTGCFLAPMAGTGVPPLVLLLNEGPAGVRMRAAVEEWLHLLAWCELGDTLESDPGHRVWTVLQPEAERRLGL